MLSSLLLFAAAGPFAAPAQTPTLLVDLEPGLSTPNANFDGRANARGVGAGRLWFWGEAAGESSPVFSVTPGSNVLQVQQLPVAAGPAFELQEVTDLGPGRALLTLQGGDPEVRRLLGTDGTLDGTEVIAVGFDGTFDPGIVVKPSPVQAGLAFFLLNTPEGPDTIFRTDGTLAGTEALLSAQNLLEFQPVGDLLVFKEGGQLGSWPVIRSIPSAGGQATTLLDGNGTIADPPVFAGGRLLFSWFDPAAQPKVGVELYGTDGTPAGTGLVDDVRPGELGAGPQMLAGEGNVAYFSGSTLAKGRELWTTDGTAAGTRLVVELKPGPADGLLKSDQGRLLNGRLIFTAAETGIGGEVFVTDGTAVGTSVIVDLVPGGGGSLPRDLNLAGNGVFLTADAGAGREPYWTDGNVLKLVGDVLPGPEGSLDDELDDPAEQFVEFDGRVWFGARRTPQDREPFSTDLDGGDLQAEPQIGVPPLGLSSSPDRWVSAGTVGYFTAERPGLSGSPRSLFVTDGTAAGTTELLSFTEAMGAPEPLGPLNQGLLFQRQSLPGAGADVLQLWFTDGTPGAEIQLPLAVNGAPRSPTLVRFGDQLGRFVYLAIETSEEGVELWRTDGTPAGTELVRDLVPGPDDGLPVNDGGGDLCTVGDRLYFRARGTPQTTQLWSTDGTAGGTAPVAPDVLANLFGVRDLLPVGDRLAFRGVPSSIWTTDATSSGTSLLFDLNSGTGTLQDLGRAGEVLLAPSVAPLAGDSALLAVSEAAPIQTLLGGIDGPITLLEQRSSSATFRVDDSDPQVAGIYVTDGTVAGTRRTDELLEQFLVGSGPEALQSRAADALGFELWLTDSDVGPGALLVDIAPGPQSSTPAPLGRVGDAFLFSAFTLEHGRELHAVSVTGVGGFAVQAYAQGCGSLPRPDLEVTGEARLASTVSIELRNLQPFAAATLHVGLGAAPAPLGTCIAYPAPPLLPAALVAGPEGSIEVPFAIPADPVFVGLQLVLQGSSVALGGPVAGLLELTNPVEVLFGP